MTDTEFINITKKLDHLFHQLRDYRRNIDTEDTKWNNINWCIESVALWSRYSKYKERTHDWEKILKMVNRIHKEYR